MTLPFPPREEIARLTARMLLEIGAVHFNAAEPYTYASGLKGPTYIDCRKLISYPRIRGTLMDFMAGTVCRDAGFEAVEFWWPFAEAVPADRDVERFVTAIDDAGVRLTHLNLAGGDLAAGERGPREVERGDGAGAAAGQGGGEAPVAVQHAQVPRGRRASAG